MNLKITTHIQIPESEISFTFTRSPGPGGQNVNKTATAAELRFDVAHSSSIPEAVRARFIILAGNQMTQQGEYFIKASRYRTQERNKQDALQRLKELLKRAAIIPKRRKKTRPTFSAVQRRLTEKTLHAKTKSLRRNKPEHD